VVSDAGLRRRCAPLLTAAPSPQRTLQNHSGPIRKPLQNH
jgi:hypothetical protein